MIKKIIILVFTVIVISLTTSISCLAQLIRIDNWLVAGSFSADITQNPHNYSFFDEPSVAPQDGERIGTAKWKKTSASVIDFKQLGFEQSSNCAAYAFTYLYATTDELATIFLGSDDGAIVWLNGIKVWDKLIKRGIIENEDVVNVQLSKGWNRLLIKIDQIGGGWGMVCNIKATGIKAELERPNQSEIAKKKEVFITSAKISGISKDKANLIIKLSNYGASKTGPFHCSLNDAKGKRMSQASLTSIDPGTSSEVAISCSIKELCNALSENGSEIVMTSSKEKNSVVIGDETATDLLRFIANDKSIGNKDMQKMFTNIDNALMIYSSANDFTPLVRKSLKYISENKTSSVIPILGEIEQSVLNNSPDLRNDSIYISGHAHMDMNWLWPYQESVKMMHDNVRQTIAFMEQFPDFRMLQSQATIYKHIEKMDPPLFEKVKKYVKEGRFELVGGMWTEGDCNLSGGEALCRSFLLGQRYFSDKFGKIAHVGWLPDNFGHISQFPQILNLSGCSYFYFHRCPPYIGPFRWKGPDNSSEVLCFANYGYNGDITPSIKDDIKRIVPNTHILFQPTGVGDHGGGPTLKNILMVHQLDSTPHYPSIKFASVESFFKATKDLNVVLPIHQSEMQFIFEGCYTSVAEIKENTRKSEQMMYKTEFLSTLRWLNGEPYPATDLKEMWETVTFNQFHDILPGSAIYETYQDAVADHKQVQKKANEIFESDFRKLADEIDFKKGLGQPIVALNLQPRSKKVLVEAEIYTHEQPATAMFSSWGDYYEFNHVQTNPGYKASTLMVRDASGKSYPAQIIGGKAFPPGFRSRIQFVVDNIPAGGYRTFYADATNPGISTQEIQEKDGLFETDFFTVAFDMKTGDIMRLIDKHSGKDYVSANGRLNKLQMWMEAPNGMNAWTIGEIKEIQDIKDVESVKITECGPVRATVEVVKKWGRSKFIQRTYIYKTYPRIDFDLDAHWFEIADGTKNAPFLKTVFDLSIDNPTFYNQVPFDVVKRPATGQEVPAQQWVDVSNGQTGIALMNKTKFGHSLEKGQLRLSLLRATYSPDLYPNIGINHIQYSLYPHSGNWENGVWAEAENFNIPIYAAEPPSLALVKSHATRPQEDSLLVVSPSTIIMSGIKQSEDGTSLIIRLSEVLGKEVLGTVSLPVSAISASRVNIIEFPLETLNQPIVEGRTIKIKLEPHEIVTLAIKVTNQ